MIDYKIVFEENAKLFGEIYECVITDDVTRLLQLVAGNTGLLHVPVFGDAVDGCSLLHQAALSGSFKVCETLLAHGVDVDVLDGCYLTPLIYATELETADLAFWFLDQGAAVNGDCRGLTTPLIQSAKCNHVDLAKRLLSSGAEVNRLQCKFNQTALDTALIYGSQPVADLIIGAGGGRAQAPIDLAAERGSGILEHIFHRVGPVLLHKTSVHIDRYQVELRTALVGKGTALKLLFTVGVYQARPMVEFMMCLPYDFPINDASVQSELPVAFPTRMLSHLAARRLSGEPLSEGDLFEPQSVPELAQCWPAGVDALVLVDYRFDGEEPAFDAQDNVQLLLVAPIKYPKAGRPGAAKLEAWIAKRRLASWKAVMTAARQKP